MTHHDMPYEQILRRALHAAADGVEPEADGLERIRARLTVPSPLPIAWMSAALAAVSAVTLGWLQAASERMPGTAQWLRSGPLHRGWTAVTALPSRLGLAQRLPTVSGWLHTAGQGLRAGTARLNEAAGRLPAPKLPAALRPAASQGRPVPGARPRPQGWLRTVPVVAVAIVIVGIGALALIRLPQTLSSATGGGLPGLSNSGGNGGPAGSANGTGKPIAGSQQSGSSHSITPFISRRAGTAICPPSVPPMSGDHSTKPSPGATASTSPSAPPASPSSSPTASASPSPTASASPSTSGSPSPSTSPPASDSPSPGTSSPSSGENSSSPAAPASGAQANGTVTGAQTAAHFQAQSQSVTKSTGGAAARAAGADQTPCSLSALGYQPVQRSSRTGAASQPGGTNAGTAAALADVADRRGLVA